MAVIFLRSTTGSDANAGTLKEAPKATLPSALTAAGAGGTIYVSGLHAETAAATKTLASPGTAANPVRIVCVADWGAETGSGVPTAVATTATVTTTGNTLIYFNGHAHCYGITFSAGSGANATYIWFGQNAMPFDWVLDACALSIPSTATTQPAIFFGFQNAAMTDRRVVLNNTPISFGATGKYLSVECRLEWRNTANAVGGTAPTTLFVPYSSGRGVVDFYGYGLDLSAMGTGRNLVSVVAPCAGRFRFQNCRLGSSVATTTGTHPGGGGTIVELINCDSADTNYRYHRNCFEGDIYSESTIVMTGGATDGVSISRKMVSSANVRFEDPLVSDPITFYVAGGTNVTATIETVTDGVTLTDAEAWIEAEYDGDSNYPLSSFASDRAANVLATPANQTTSSVTWTTTGLGSPVKQKLAVSFLTQDSGVVKIRVCLARASTTMYFNPWPAEISSSRQEQIDGHFINELTSGSGGGGSPIGLGSPVLRAA